MGLDYAVALLGQMFVFVAANKFFRSVYLRFAETPAPCSLAEVRSTGPSAPR